MRARLAQSAAAHCLTERLFMPFVSRKQMGWMHPLTASKCQDAIAVRRSRANRSHPHGDTFVGLDLAKSFFQIHAVVAAGAVVVRKAVRRTQVLSFFAKLPPCLVGIEACGTSHHWARELGKLGHEVRLMPPAYVKPYVKRGKQTRTTQRQSARPSRDRGCGPYQSNLRSSKPR